MSHAIPSANLPAHPCPSHDCSRLDSAASTGHSWICDSPPPLAWGGVKWESWWLVFITRSDYLWQSQKTDTWLQPAHTSLHVVSPILYAYAEVGYHSQEPYSILRPVLFLFFFLVEPYNVLFSFQSVSQEYWWECPVAPFPSLLACQH